jgi:hypothetical protein
MATLFTEPDIANLSLDLFCIPLVNKTTFIAKGYCNIKVEDGLVKVGSAVEVGGSLYYSMSDELITGVKKQENIVYAVLGAGNIQFTYSSTRPTFNPVKGGWYNGNDRAVQFGLNGTGIVEMPVGFVYTQYPGKVEPQYLFPGVWTIETGYAGAFFRAEGGYAFSFGGGKQSDMIKYHKHQYATVDHNAISLNGDGYNATRYTWNESKKTTAMLDKSDTPLADNGDTENQLPENRPANYTFRIWTRTA